MEEAAKLSKPACEENFSCDNIEPDHPDDKFLKRHFLVWPSANLEVEDELELEELVKPDAWVHTCPILSHRGVVIPFELPPEEEEEQADDEDAGDDEGEEEA